MTMLEEITKQIEDADESVFLKEFGNVTSLTQGDFI
jgi:hypothetical protein